jgi:benzodiazapine receptor
MNPILQLFFLLLAVNDVHSFSNARSSLGRVTRTDGNSRITSSSTSASPTASTTTTKLRALPVCLGNVPPWTYFSLLHILGGCSGTPIVVRATKSWYNRIPLPSWTPPNFVFAPVWTTLYGLMGVSVSRILKSVGRDNIAMKLWAVHYVLNLVWAPVFFGFQQLRLGLAINVFLISTLSVIIPLFHRIDPLSAYLQVPYLLWLLYATKLNQSICKLNPMVEGVNEARLQADLCSDGRGYNDAMLEYDIKKLQAAAAKYAGL